MNKEKNIINVTTSTMIVKKSEIPYYSHCFELDELEGNIVKCVLDFIAVTEELLRDILENRKIAFDPSDPGIYGTAESSQITACTNFSNIAFGELAEKLRERRISSLCRDGGGTELFDDRRQDEQYAAEGACPSPTARETPEGEASDERQRVCSEAA